MKIYVSTQTFLLLTLFCAVPHAAHAILVKNISTGIDSSNSLIALDTLEDDWSIVAAPNGVPTGAAMVVSPSRNHFIELEPYARWISPNAETNYFDAPWGDYVFQTSFDLSGVEYQSVTIAGDWAADNLLTGIALNGQKVFTGPLAESACLPLGYCEEFWMTSSFSLTNLAGLVDGINQISFTVNNPGPTRTNPVSFLLHASVEMTPIAVPEPATLPLMAIGFLGLWYTRAYEHKRRRYP